MENYKYEKSGVQRGAIVAVTTSNAPRIHTLYSIEHRCIVLSEGISLAVCNDLKTFFLDILLIKCHILVSVFWFPWCFWNSVSHSQKSCYCWAYPWSGVVVPNLLLLLVLFLESPSPVAVVSLPILTLHRLFNLLQGAPHSTYRSTVLLKSTFLHPLDIHTNVIVSLRLFRNLHTGYFPDWNVSPYSPSHSPSKVSACACHVHFFSSAFFVN